MTLLTLPDPRELKPSHRKGLQLLAQPQRLYRTTRGWGHAPNRITLDLGAQLRAKGLARVELSGRAPALVLTGDGQAVHAVIEQRRERKRA